VVIAPGNLYTSLAPTLLVEGMSEALAETKAKVVYVCNLVTKPGQTDGFKVHDYVCEIERFMGTKLVDYVIYNQRQPTAELLKKYAQAGEYAVEFDDAAVARAHYEAIGEDLVSDAIPKLKPSEKLIPRTLIRHDSDKVARLIMEDLFQLMNPTTAVIFAAGTGTRMLPITAVVQKEMLPILNRPVIDYIVSDLVSAGIKRIIFVIRPGQTSLKEFYLGNPGFQQALERQHKTNALALLDAVHSQSYLRICRAAARRRLRYRYPSPHRTTPARPQ